MTTLIQQRRDLAAAWASANPVLQDGEIGVDKTNKTLRIGDGSTHWNDIKLPYIPAAVYAAKGDLVVGESAKTPVKLTRGATDQMLVVQSDGHLAWVTVPIFSSFETTAHAVATYETNSAADTVHADKITAAAMGTTYQTQVACGIAHGALETFTHASSTFQTISAAATAYEPKWQTAVKQVTQGTSNTTTLISDTELIFYMEANALYVFELFLSYVATVSGQMKVTMACPTAAVSSWSMHAPTTSLASGAANGPSHWASNGGSPNATPIGVGGAGATSPLFLTMKGVVKTGANSGGVVLQHAQLTAIADTGYLVQPGSYLRAFRVS